MNYNEFFLLSTIVFHALISIFENCCTQIRFSISNRILEIDSWKIFYFKLYTSSILLSRIQIHTQHSYLSVLEN